METVNLKIKSEEERRIGKLKNWMIPHPNHPDEETYTHIIPTSISKESYDHNDDDVYLTVSECKKILDTIEQYAQTNGKINVAIGLNSLYISISRKTSKINVALKASKIETHEEAKRRIAREKKKKEREIKKAKEILAKYGEKL